MQERKCSKCSSVNMYKNMGNNWYKDGLTLQMFVVDSFPALFQTEVFLCVDCRNLDIQVLETSTMYEKQITLAETIKASNNWRKA